MIGLHACGHLAGMPSELPNFCCSGATVGPRAQKSNESQGLGLVHTTAVLGASWGSGCQIRTPMSMLGSHVGYSPCYHPSQHGAGQAAASCHVSFINC